MSILFSLLKPWVVGVVKTHFTRHPYLLTTLTGGLTLAFAYFMLYRRVMRKDKLLDVMKNKQMQREQQFKKLRSQYKTTAETTRITNLSWDNLVNQLQSRKLKAVKVLEAYIAKSLEANTFSNAVTEYYTKAYDIALKLDKLPNVKGPLHGIPFCVKDDTDLDGMDSTLGFSKNCFKPKEKIGGLVSTLIHLGAVPFCKTNVPQTLLNYASDNPIFGTTSSSHNKKLGPGGSSSGTGALVGGNGALFGTGSDIGGSLRIPAHFNGVSSLKPTAGRLSTSGTSAVLPNIMGLDATTGIIGANAKVVATVYKNLLTDCVQSKFDQQLAPIPWNMELYSSKKKLRIGYFTQVPFFPPIGDTVEVVEKAVKVLKSEGHTLVPMTLPDGARIMRCAANFLMADENRQLVALWKGEKIAECAKLNHLATKVPFWVTRLVKFLMKQKFISILYSPSMASIVDSGSFKSFQLWDNTGEKKKLMEEILTTWNKLELDCCVSPVMPFPALPVNLPGLLPIGAVYTMIWNVVNFPAGVVRFGKESGKNIDNFDNRGDQGFKLAQKGCKESIGSPIGIQVVGLPFKDELVLRVMEDLEGYALK